MLHLLIPAYRPDERLVALVRALREAMPDARLLVIDDGSGEAYRATFTAARDAGARVLRHGTNCGKGAALKTGLADIARHDDAPRVVTADADGQHTPGDIARVAERLARGDADLVLGARAFDGDVPARSRIGNALARRLLEAATGLRLRDTQTGLRGLSPAAVAWSRAVRGDRFEYEQRVLLAAARRDARVVEVDIATRYLDGNSSSHFRPVRDSLRVVAPVAAFAASSLVGFGIDTVALLALTAVGVPLVGAVVGARVASATANFTLNRRFVFRGARRGPLVPQLARYALLAIALLALNAALLSWLTTAGWPLLAAKLVVEAGLFVASFAVQRLAVFGRRRREARLGHDRPGDARSSARATAAIPAPSVTPPPTPTLAAPTLAAPTLAASPRPGTDAHARPVARIAAA